MQPTEGRLKVLLIAGLGRSGSTVLGRLCGELPGFAAVGELGQLWTNGFVDNVLCGCGQPIRRCGFWRAVIDSACGGFDGIAPETLGALREFWAARRRLAVHFALPLPLRAAHRTALATYRQHLARVLAAVRTVSGCRVLVDTSKTPAQLVALAGIDAVELHVVHLVRDSRAVANSWRQRRRRQQVAWTDAYVEPITPARTALLWNGINALTWCVRRGARSYMRVRYEDFARTPHPILRGLLQQLGEAPDLAALGDDDEHRAAQHTVAGNPIRFDSGPLEIRLETAWEQAMPLRSKLGVTALTWPLLLAYGYPLLPPPFAARPQSAGAPS